MADPEVLIDLEGRTCPVGLACGNKVRGNEAVVFEYAPEWLADDHLRNHGFLWLGRTG
jgi:serine/threonine-protein kinase HipA